MSEDSKKYAQPGVNHEQLHGFVSNHGGGELHTITKTVKRDGKTFQQTFHVHAASGADAQPHPDHHEDVVEKEKSAVKAHIAEAKKERGEIVKQHLKEISDAATAHIKAHEKTVDEFLDQHAKEHPFYKDPEDGKVKSSSEEIERIRSSAKESLRDHLDDFHHELKDEGRRAMSVDDLHDAGKEHIAAVKSAKRDALDEQQEDHLSHHEMVQTYRDRIADSRREFESNVKNVDKPDLKGSVMSPPTRSSWKDNSGKLRHSEQQGEFHDFKDAVNKTMVELSNDVHRNEGKFLKTVE